MPDRSNIVDRSHDYQCRQCDFGQRWHWSHTGAILRESQSRDTGAMEQRTLGRTGLKAGPIGMAASYGVPAAAVERAFERGVNYLYWGSLRRAAFAEAIRNLASQRDRMVVVVQSFSRIAALVGWSLENSLSKLRLDHADILLFGLWNKPLPPRILEAGFKLQQRGLTRFLALSTHHRPLAAQLA